MREGHVCLADYCNVFKDQWRRRSIEERSYFLANAACCSGLCAPVNCVCRVLFHASIANGSKWGVHGRLISEDLAWAKGQYASDVSLNYPYCDTGLQELSEACGSIVVEREDGVDELWYSLLADEPALDHQLQAGNEQYRQSKEDMEKCIGHTYAKIGC